jgi:ABC-type transporter Mla subunit MlaD
MNRNQSQNLQRILNTAADLSARIDTVVDLASAVVASTRAVADDFARAIERMEAARSR